MTDLNYFAEII